MKYQTKAILPTNEKISHVLYEHYCTSVGGQAFNGDTLPSASVFFSDPTKEKQASAWRSTAMKAAQLLRPECLGEQCKPDFTNVTEY